jgi:tetratricopeptide (TPR) repeat protein
MSLRPLIANSSKGQSRNRAEKPASHISKQGITIAIYLALAVITVTVFGQTIRDDFVNFDDDLYVYNSPVIKAGLTINGMLLAFTTPHARNWHPLTTISHMLDYQVWGLRAGGHHATNVILHTIAVLLLFSLLKRMTGAVWKSVLVAALFAVHPLHVESVAWISERKDVLSALFFFLMLGAYVRYTSAPSRWRYLLVSVLFAAGLMSKPMLVTAPVVLFLLDYWPLERFKGQMSQVRDPNTAVGAQWSVTRGLILEKIPLLLLSVASCVVTFVIQKRAVGAIPSLPWLWRVENAVTSYLLYVWQTLWPARLAVFYPYPDNTLPAWKIIFALGLLVATTVAAIVLRHRRPYLFTGWLWYVVMLMPVIGIVQVGEQGHADRYTYLPHIGLFLLAVWGVADVVASRRAMSRITAVTAAITIFALAWVAFAQTRYWHDSETLWTHALAVTSDNDFAHNNLAYLLADRGDLDDAISHFEAAAEIRSHKRDRHYNVGSALVEMNLADALAKKDRLDEAMFHYEQAIRLEPNYPDAYYNRGSVLFAKGRIDEAIADWERTLQLQPNDADAHVCLGNAFLRQGSPREAIAHYETAATLGPQDPHSRNNLGWILATASDAGIRDGAKAVEFAQQAVALSGGREPQFFRTLAAAYAESGRFSDAVVTAQQAAVIAGMQGKSQLAKHLEEDVLLYRARLALRQNFSND